jgi:hypothetical protein
MSVEGVMTMMTSLPGITRIRRVLRERTLIQAALHLRAGAPVIPVPIVLRNSRLTSHEGSGPAATPATPDFTKNPRLFMYSYLVYGARRANCRTRCGFHAPALVIAIGA